MNDIILVQNNKQEELLNEKILRLGEVKQYVTKLLDLFKSKS